jgi:hypothetical protein
MSFLITFSEFYALQEYVPKLRSQYSIYEDAFFGKLKGNLCCLPWNLYCIIYLVT